MLTQQDIEDAIQLGYVINIPSNLATQQLNDHFPGVDLNKLLDEIESLLAAHTRPPAYKRLVINSATDPQFIVLYLSDNYSDPERGLTLKRTFEYEHGNLVVHHDYLVLPKKARGQGLAKKILGIWFDQYLNMGVKHIYVHAGLKDGGAVWAKMGFKGLRKDEMQRVLRSAKRRLKGTEELEAVIAIFDAYYKKEPNGISFPIRRWADIDLMEPVLKSRKNNWHGWVDLTNPEELRNFKINVGR